MAECIRITPACAGKTSAARVTRAACQDHPRVCGENDWLRDKVVEMEGSPPRVRGKHWDKAWNGLKERITPACAGKTDRAHREAFGTQDHPRVCGENAPVAPSMLDFMGSPPRVRGKL